MATDLQIKYTADSIEGNSLSTSITNPEHGWVEYCNQHGQLFFADAVSEEFYQKCHEQVIDRIADYILTQDKKRLGFINHLSTVLLDDDFVLPMFGVVPLGENKLEITTGFSRLIASIMNSRKAHELKTISFAPKSHEITQLKNAKPLTSTDMFEKIYNLADVDYEIAMLDSPSNDMTKFRFDRSVLKYSIYDKKDQALPHLQTGSSILLFWDRHTKNNKIKLNVRCTPEVEKLIQPSKFFTYNVVHEKENEWQWSYGKILSSYRKTEEPLGYNDSRLHLWLYDVTEPVYLELLFPWISGQYSCCHTKNKKSLFFDNSVNCTSIQIIGDWVK